MKNKTHKLSSIWEKVPVDYYQKGTKTNFFQKTWHYFKITSAKKMINCLTSISKQKIKKGEMMKWQ